MMLVTPRTFRLRRGRRNHVSRATWGDGGHLERPRDAHAGCQIHALLEPVIRYFVGEAGSDRALEDPADASRTGKPNRWHRSGARWPSTGSPGRPAEGESPVDSSITRSMWAAVDAADSGISRLQNGTTWSAVDFDAHAGCQASDLLARTGRRQSASTQAVGSRRDRQGSPRAWASAVRPRRRGRRRGSVHDRGFAATPREPSPGAESPLADPTLPATAARGRIVDARSAPCAPRRRRPRLPRRCTRSGDWQHCRRRPAGVS